MATAYQAASRQDNAACFSDVQAPVEGDMIAELSVLSCSNVISFQRYRRLVPDLLSRFPDVVVPTRALLKN